MREGKVTSRRKHKVITTNNRLLTNHCTNQVDKEYKYGSDKSDIFVDGP